MKAGRKAETGRRRGREGAGGGDRKTIGQTIRFLYYII